MTFEVMSSLPPAFAKRRYLLKPGGIRLLREASWANYARTAVPISVNGFQVNFPETRTELGWHVTVWTSRMTGEPLLSLLYDSRFQNTAVDAGLAALEALHLADLRLIPSSPFGWTFRFIKGMRLLSQTTIRAALLMPAEEKELRRLVRRYIFGQSEKPVLTHGDLHASHVLVDRGRNALGIIDLEAMHVGKGATNFAQLWDGFHYADKELGRQLFERYAAQHDAELNNQFDNDVRLEIALRSYRHILVGQQTKNMELTEKAARLFHWVLSGASFDSMYDGRK
jgi:aminoglycoside phosphotransferase (APT) family kinase protein